MLFCCAGSREEVAGLVVDLKDYQLVRLSDNETGKNKSLKNNGMLFYSKLQFAGSVDPVSGIPGLDLLSGYVIYNGLEWDFHQSLAHFRDNPSLHIYSGIFLQKECVLYVSQNRVEVRGSRHALVFTSVRNNGSEPGFEMAQYGPGEGFSYSSNAGKPGR